ncbi:plasma-membrane choline transporter-domain-containing protein [Phycomyces blakesleeanus]|uniref:Protein PNS1 n=1 Tax=Phycomyces blakesleeanus TaxID=4837 RepID=A0ABR3AX34_PHYBL
MEKSMPNIARFFSTLKNSLLEPNGARSAYAQMDQESENEDEYTSHSLFYSLQQDQMGIDSMPLTESNAYSDTSQLIFDQEELMGEPSALNLSTLSASRLNKSDYEESPKPSAIYLDVPSTAIAPITAPLSESLLPTTAAIPPGITTIKTEKKYKDPLFGLAYCLLIIVYVLSGILLVCTTDSHALEKAAKGTTFKAISDSAGILTLMVFTTLLVGICWFHVLRKFTKAIVWGTVTCVPIIFVGLFIWALVESFQSYYYYGNQPSAQDSGLTIMSFIPLIISLFYMKLVFSGRHRINKTVAVIELACEILKSNPGILLVSLILLVVFISFSALWLLFFSRLWLLGHIEKSGSKSEAIWVVNDHVNMLVVFYLFIYMWTAAVLINMQRFVLSAVTAQWYFHRHEPATTNSEKAWKSALIRGSTTSLGTLAFGGLVLTLVQSMHLLAQYMKKYVKKSRPFVWIVSILLAYLEAIVSQINHYTISLAGITGESFCSSARSGTKMFRRNLLSGLLGDLLTKLILYIGALVISLVSGLGTYVFATHSLHSPHGYIIGMLAAIVPMYISQFFSYTMMSM